MYRSRSLFFHGSALNVSMACFRLFILIGHLYLRGGYSVYIRIDIGKAYVQRDWTMYLNSFNHSMLNNEHNLEERGEGGAASRLLMAQC